MQRSAGCRLAFTCWIGAALSMLSATVIAAGDPGESLAEAKQLYEDGDISGALQEARWAVELLEQLKQGQITEYFHDEVLGYRGGELSDQRAMGFAVTERTYTKDSKSITVTLTGGAGGADLGGLGALAQMGMAMQTGQRVRIQRRTGVAVTEGGNVTINVTLNSGGLLSFASATANLEELTAFAEAFPVAELDDARAQ